jgi:hypothetical protein
MNSDMAYKDSHQMGGIGETTNPARLIQRDKWSYQQNVAGRANSARFKPFPWGHASGLSE